MLPKLGLLVATVLVLTTSVLGWVRRDMPPIPLVVAETTGQDAQNWYILTEEGHIVRHVVQLAGSYRRNPLFAGNDIYLPTTTDGNIYRFRYWDGHPGHAAQLTHLTDGNANIIGWLPDHELAIVQITTSPDDCAYYLLSTDGTLQFWQQSVAQEACLWLPHAAQIGTTPYVAFNFQDIGWVSFALPLPDGLIHQLTSQALPATYLNNSVALRGVGFNIWAFWPDGRLENVTTRMNQYRTWTLPNNRHTLIWPKWSFRDGHQFTGGILQIIDNETNTALPITDMQEIGYICSNPTANTLYMLWYPRVGGTVGMRSAIDVNTGEMTPYPEPAFPNYCIRQLVGEQRYDLHYDLPPAVLETLQRQHPNAVIRFVAIPPMWPIATWHPAVLLLASSAAIAITVLVRLWRAK